MARLCHFQHFYPAVDEFLDTAVKRTIEQAADNHALQAFDATILKVLFLIRYIDELPGSVDNLVTLCRRDRRRQAGRRNKIEESLSRLEGETLIDRNGDLDLFLTNEERDIGREIKSVSVPSGAEERELGRLLFEKFWVMFANTRTALPVGTSRSRASVMITRSDTNWKAASRSPS